MRLTNREAKARVNVKLVFAGHGARRQLPFIAAGIPRHTKIPTKNPGNGPDSLPHSGQVLLLRSTLQFGLLQSSEWDLS